MFPKKIENPKDVCIYDMVTVIRYCGEKVDAARFIRDDLTLDNIETKGAEYFAKIRVATNILY